MQALQWFYACGTEARKEGEGPARRVSGRKERGYDFKHDISLIYSAFRSVYEMDLTKVGSLHWWVFCSMFSGLPGSTPIRELMHARTAKVEKPTREQKEQRAAVALPEHLRWLSADGGRIETAEEWAARIRAKREKG